MRYDFYVYQHPSYALGNFVNCTPTIKRLYDKLGKPIPVLFGTRYVADAYRDCEYIEHIDRPNGKRLFGSDMICRDNKMPDYEYIQSQVLGRPFSNEGFIPVDEIYRPALEDLRYRVIACGSGNPDPKYVDGKTPPLEILMKEVEGSPVPVIFVGSEEDYHRAKPLADLCYERAIGNIRACVTTIALCEMFIGNDTGFAHVAGVLKKPMRVYWKDTKFPKNANTNLECEYIFKNKWQ